MNSKQRTAYGKLKTMSEKASFLLTMGVTAKVQILDLAVVNQAFVGDCALPVIGSEHESAESIIAKGEAWLMGKL